ncbi:MAG: NAD(P)H-binding protein [Propionibacteriaceae bacterium]|jgi:putative NADH-flavin reductase|nr:NAD(P)H-binding protein [Propionibacteriaceae bacterium]
MKVAIFGATGRTGRELVCQSLGRGYDVVAYARDPSRISSESPCLTKKAGKLDSRQSLRIAIEGCDCVLSALGPMGKQGDEELCDGIANILSVMEEYGVVRFIALSTTSAQDISDIESFRTKLRRGMIRRGRPTSYEQIVRYSQLIRDSSCGWTLVRIASILTDKPLSKQVRAGYLGRDSFRNTLSRADLAWFMLEQVESNEYLRKAPALSN